jgi:hypothetical protein
MLSDAIDSGNRAYIGALTVECDTEGITYVCWAVKTYGKSCACAETQLEQVVINQNAIRLNGTGANGGQAISKTLEQSFKNVSREKKRFTAVKDDGKWVLLVFVQRCKLLQHILDGTEGHVLWHALPARIALVIDVTVAAIDIASRRHF